eukprot:SM006929S21013  [mRNA]  locus=s6929:93:761:+ [translate_table: standard]
MASLEHQTSLALRGVMEGLALGEGAGEADVAPGTMTVPLMKHQRLALAWMEKRESGAYPAGGILADDQGLGKTVSTIALILKCRAPTTAAAMPPSQNGGGDGEVALGLLAAAVESAASAGGAEPIHLLDDEEEAAAAA